MGCLSCGSCQNRGGTIPPADNILSDAHLNDVYQDLVKARITELVCSEQVARKTVPEISESRWKFLDKWLNDKAQERLQEIITAKEKNDFVLLSSQGYLDWWNALFQAVIAIVTLGGGFTFGIIFSDIQKPQNSEATVDRVRNCLITSWILFVTSVAWASFAILILGVNKKLFLKAMDSGEKWDCHILLFAVTWAVLIQMMLPVGAFLAAAEAVRQYHNRLGIACHALIGFIGALMLVAWILQNFFFSGPGSSNTRADRSEKVRRCLRID